MSLFFFFVCIVLILVLILIWTIKNGISPAPTSRKIQKALNVALPENLEGNLIELGSGWGGMALFLAKKYPKAHVIAYETSPIPWAISKVRAWFYAQKNLRFERKDFFLLPLSPASLLFCYLSSPLMQRLQEKISKEVLFGTLIVSHTFALPGYTPSKSIQVHDLYLTKIYFYLT